MQPAILPIQMLRLGQLIILSVPGGSFLSNSLMQRILISRQCFGLLRNSPFLRDGSVETSSGNRSCSTGNVTASTYLN